ncbi:hypothetical protein V6N13_100069 [Hibiscus sabdariffa]
MFDWVTFQGFTCVEWGVIISSFGKFRRFAERFFIKKTALTSLVISDDIFSEFYYSVADEIFEGSRLKAVSMMDAAIEV